MDTKIKVMISLGSSYSAGCIPCFDHYYMLAKEKTTVSKVLNQKTV
ncbi:hypothetical protein ACFLZM_07095 [Thermodesulfobacteriota bacterium]